MNQAILYPNFYEVTQSISLGRLVITIGIGYIYLVTDGSGSERRYQLCDSLPTSAYNSTQRLDTKSNKRLPSRKVFAGLNNKDGSVDIYSQPTTAPPRICYYESK